MNTQDNIVKPCLFNFIIYNTEPRRAEYFQGIINTVIEKFPCRIIFIKGDAESEQEKFKVDISTLRSKQEARIVCDSITIEASGSQMAKVPFAILSYLVPDMPVYLTWGQDPCTENQLLFSLEKLATRLIVDSECTDNLPLFSQKMLNKIQHLKCDVIDMNWASSQGWRNTIAQIFDNHQKIEQLRQAEMVKIFYNRINASSFYHHEIQALYLQAWLATQLNWKFSNLETVDQSTRFYYNSKQKQVIVDLIPKQVETFSPGSLLGFDVSTFDQCHYEIKREEKSPQHVLIQITTQEVCDLPYLRPLSSRNTGFTFIKEVLYAPTSNHYIAMLQTIAQHQLSVSVK